jgi:GTPase SAR1 family protein
MYFIIDVTTIITTMSVISLPNTNKLSSTITIPISSPLSPPVIPLFIQKYKPYTIDEFCADSKLKTVLKTLLSIDDLNILLIGNACSGKTTILNAIIREYYQIDHTRPFPEHNILYINNLKEQGIGFYRNEMKTFSQSHCTIFGKKKMIIIDDIDTINEQSQHVFRNYIDKYKNNIHFLSVCTNIQKVIESIQSRVHIIRIDPPSHQQVQQLMDTIIQEERLFLTPECKDFILKYSKNSIRTMMNYMEKIYVITAGAGDGTGTPVISLESCMNICADIKIHVFEKYIAFLKDGQLTDAIDTMYGIHDYGFSVIDILELFFIFVKTTPLLMEHEKYEIIRFLCKYITIFYSIHEDIIELALFTNNLYKLLRTNVSSVLSILSISSIPS